MARNPNYSYNFSMIDRSGESARFTINTPDLGAIDVIPTLVTDFQTALTAVADGLVTNISTVGARKITNAAFSTDGQREEKWLLTYQDNTTFALYQTEIPCRKASVKPPQGTDDVDLAVAPWPAFKTAFEALATSPDGNGVTLLKVTLIGRNV